MPVRYESSITVINLKSKSALIKDNNMTINVNPHLRLNNNKHNSNRITNNNITVN
ncbi:MAG: hypothetical protein IJJ11_04510 [Methanosphaera sp.]|nr:hypothetical protein [Methanosphaera sp.]